MNAPLAKGIPWRREQPCHTPRSWGMMPCLVTGSTLCITKGSLGRAFRNQHLFSHYYGSFWEGEADSVTDYLTELWSCSLMLSCFSQSRHGRKMESDVKQRRARKHTSFSLPRMCSRTCWGKRCICNHQLLLFRSPNEVWITLTTHGGHHAPGCPSSLP